jgi:hypothetical protein
MLCLTLSHLPSYRTDVCLLRGRKKHNHMLIFFCSLQVLIKREGKYRNISKVEKRERNQCIEHCFLSVMVCVVCDMGIKSEWYVARKC